MPARTFTLRVESGWALFWGAVRLGMLVFIGFHAPWYVTVLAGLMQLRFESWSS